MKQYNLLFWFALLGFAFWWIIPLGTYGLFDDGVWYGCISRNWAFSNDTNWWHLIVSPTLDPQFNGHPPLAFWMEGLLFMILGEYFWIEHVYSILMAVISAWAIYHIWHKVYSNRKDVIIKVESGYLPIVMWLMMPIVGWSYGNNMLENTLCALTLWATYFLIPNSKKHSEWIDISLGGILIFLATLTKGPVGLYPLVIIGFHWLIFRHENFNKALIKTVCVILILILAYSVLVYISPNAKAYLSHYVDLQLYRSIAGENAVTSRFLVIEKMILEPAIALSILIVGWVIIRLKHVDVNEPYKKAAYFFFLIAVSIAIPLLISPKQMPWYSVPAMPFMSLAFAVLFLPIWPHISPYISSKKWIAYSAKTLILIAFLIMFFRWGSFGRNQEMLSDVFRINQIVPPHDTIGIHNEVYKRWNLHGYLYRFGHVNLFTASMSYKHWLLLPGEPKYFDTSAYNRIDLTGYILYSQKQN